MARFVALLRGINVGGTNVIRMADLRACLEAEGFDDVRTYIQSGNVLFTASGSTATLAARLERTLSARFGRAWTGPGVLYFERLASRAGESRLSKLVSLPIYRSLTIRDRATTCTLLEMLETPEGSLSR